MTIGKRPIGFHSAFSAPIYSRMKEGVGSRVCMSICLKKHTLEIQFDFIHNSRGSVAVI